VSGRDSSFEGVGVDKNIWGRNYRISEKHSAGPKLGTNSIVGQLFLKISWRVSELVVGILEVMDKRFLEDF
jgi:hypothetical protein